MSYVTIWPIPGDPNLEVDPMDSNKIYINSSIINSTWRIRPDNSFDNSSTLFIEWCSGGKYLGDPQSLLVQGSNNGRWYFKVSGALNNVLEIGYETDDPVPVDTIAVTYAVISQTDEWRYCYACNLVMFLQAVGPSSEPVVQLYTPSTPLSTSLSDLLICQFYSFTLGSNTFVKPVELYQRSLCLLKETYNTIKCYLVANKTHSGTMSEYYRTLAISEICCALELMANLETALDEDELANADEVSPTTYDAAVDLFTYITSAKALVIVDNDGQEVKTLESLQRECSSNSYGVTQISSCRRKKYHFYLKSCDVSNGSV